MSDSSPVLWQPRDTVQVPATASPTEIAERARQLSAREIRQVTQAYQSGAYEMGSTFVWSRTMAGLKKQLATLGVEFIAEILDRPDIKSGAEIHEVLTDYDAVRLAEDLGMFGSSHALRLRHALETIHHFSDPPDDADEEGMTPEEAVGALRTCVQTVLGQEQLGIALEFTEFRRRLEAEVLPAEWIGALNLAAVPYFFKRTMVRVLIAGAKTASGAQLENLLANFNELLPVLWPLLMDPDRYSVGRLYSDLHSDGNTKAASGVRSALLKVAGFDYVPEGLRSRAFVEAASRVLATHFDWDNFHNEPAPMRSLASLGSSIPVPAFPKCITATLAVRLGNHYGRSWAAQADADRVLRGVSTDRWTYFFEKCLPVDEVVLSKLTDSEIVPRWVDLVSELPRLRSVNTSNKPLATFLKASEAGETGRIRSYADGLLAAIR